MQSAFFVAHTVSEETLRRFDVLDVVDVSHDASNGFETSCVCKAYDRVLQKHVAIKRVSNVFFDLARARHVLREMLIMRMMMLNCVDNVTQLLHIPLPPNGVYGIDYLYLVMDVMDQDLRSGMPPPGSVRLYMHQLLSALAHMHACGIVHHNLAPENILVSPESGTLKVADFGLSFMEGDPSMQKHDASLHARAAYCSPEQLWGHAYGQAVDMWNVGCLLAEMVGAPRRVFSRPLLAPPLPGPPLAAMGDRYNNRRDSSSESGSSCGESGSSVSARASAFAKAYTNADAYAYAYAYASHGDGYARDAYSCCCVDAENDEEQDDASSLAPEQYGTADSLAMDLLVSLLVVDPAKRLTAMQALQHPYFAGLPCPSVADRGHCRGPFWFDYLSLSSPNDVVLFRDAIYQEILYIYNQHDFLSCMQACCIAACNPVYSALTAVQQ